MMNTNRQTFSDNRTAIRALLSSSLGINQYDTPASFFRFARGMLYKLSPSYIGNALINGLVAVLLHSFNIQIFKDNQAESINQFSTFLMSKVRASILDTGMDVVKSLDCLAVLWRTFIQLAHLALDTFQVFFVLLYPALALNRFTRTKSSEGGQAQVNANHFSGYGQRLWFNFARKAGIPVTQRIALDSEGFNSAFDGTVKFNFNVAYFAQFKLVSNQLKSKLGIGKTVVPAIALKSWIAVLFTSLNSTKERLEGKVNSSASVTQNLNIDIFKFVLFGSPYRKKIKSIVQGKDFLFLYPIIFSDLKSFVVNPTTRFKRLLKSCYLRFCRKEAVLKCFNHTNNYTSFCAKRKLHIVPKPAEDIKPQFKTLIDNTFRDVSKQLEE